MPEHVWFYKQTDMKELNNPDMRNCHNTERNGVLVEIAIRLIKIKLDLTKGEPMG